MTLEKRLGESYNFDEISKRLDNLGSVDEYYGRVKSKYTKFFSKNDTLEVGKFAIRFYRAKKEMFSAAQMWIEADTAKKNGCLVGYFFLCYYSLFHSMQANLLICPEIPNEKVINLSHSNVKKQFEEYYCKGKKSIIDSEIIDLFEQLKQLRELYSYAMPLNNPEDAIVKTENTEYYIKLCFQLLNVHSCILYNIVKSISYTYGAEELSLENYFHSSCFKINPENGLLFIDEADQDFWHDFRWDGGMDLMPMALQLDHDFDEYGGYDDSRLREQGFDKFDIARHKAFSFIYKTIA